MASLSSELVLVQRFLALSQTYETRPAIARRNTLPTLARFLVSKDREIRRHALEAVHLLAQHPENVDLLAQDPPIVDGVFHSYREGQYDDPELHELSSCVLDLLSSAIPDGDPRRLEVLRRAAEDGTLNSRAQSASSTRRLGSEQPPEEEGCYGEGYMDDNYGMTDSTPSHASRTPQRRGSVLTRGQRNDSSHMVIFDIPALNARADTSEVEEILLSTRGVLSFTFSAHIHQVRVFMASRALKPLQEALTSAGFANLVISDERVRTHEDSAVNRGSYYDDDEEEKRPSYVQNVKNFASSLFSSVVVYSKAQDNSLAARVRRQKEVEEKDTNQTADRLAKAFARWW